MTRNEVYIEIDRERAYQATLDHTHGDGCAKTVGDYINLLGYYADEARKEWTINLGTLPAQHMIRKLVACAVACLEAHGCPPRMTKQGGKFPLPSGDEANRPTVEVTKSIGVSFETDEKGHSVVKQVQRLEPCSPEAIRTQEQFDAAIAAGCQLVPRPQAMGELEHAHAQMISDQQVKST